MDNITKAMCSQMHDRFYGLLKEEITSDNSPTNDEDGKKTYSKENEKSPVKNYVKDIYTQIQNIPASFGQLDYYPNLDKVQWSGTITDSAIKWSVIYSQEENGFFIEASNAKLRKEESLALHKLCTYFETVWYSAIRDAILNKDFA